MKTTIKLLATAALYLSAVSAHAALIAFEDVQFLNEYGHFTSPFTVTETGTYQATLTDLGFPSPFLELGLAVTTATQNLGYLDQPGSFSFQAQPEQQFYLNAFHHAANAPGLGGPLGLAGFEVRLLGNNVNVSAVPIPGSGLLLGSGLVALVGAMRRKHSDAR